MLKDNNIFENLKQVLTNSGKLNSIIIEHVLKCSANHIAQDCRSVYMRKDIISWMIIMKLMGMKSVHKMIIGPFGQIVTIGKDVLYKVKNSEMVNWRRLLLNQANKCMEGIENESTSTKDPCTIPCFIIDDTDISKRGKCIEWIGKIFSHVTHTYGLGFKSLNLAYWSGKHLLHIDFSFHVEPGKNNNQGMKAKELKARYSKQRKANSPGSQRVSELIKKKTKVAVSMIRRALRKGFEASYILADSWFFNSELAAFALKEKLHLISRPKFNNWKYEYAGKPYTIGGLIKKLRYSKQVKWNRHLRLRFVSAIVEFKGISMQVIYYKEKKKASKWQAIITTDKNLSAQRAFKIYQTRWTIEVSYKELKQLLSYGQCMSRDFDAQISDATQCLVNYNLLSHLKAIEQHQSIGMLFEQISHQWLKPTMMKKFWDAFYQAIKQLAELVSKPVEELIEKAIGNSKFLYTLQKIGCILSAET